MLLPWLQVSSLCYTLTYCRLNWNVTTLTTGQFSLLHIHSLQAQLKCYYLDYRSVLSATHSLTAGSAEMLLPWLQVSSLCYTLTYCRLNWNVTTLTTGQFSLLHTHLLQAQLECYYLDYRSVLSAIHSLTAGSTEMLLPWLQVSYLCYTLTYYRLNWNVTTLTTGQFSFLHTHLRQAQLKCYYLDYRSVLSATHSLTAGSAEMLLPWLQASSICYTLTHCRLNWNVTTLTTGQFSLLYTHSSAAGSTEMLLPWLQVSSLCYTLTHCRLNWNVTTLTTGQFSLLHTHSLQAQLKCYYLDYRSVLFATHSLTAGSTEMLLPWLQVSSLCYTLTHCRLNWNVTTLTTGQFSLLHTHSLQAQLKCYYLDYRSVLFAIHSLTAGSTEMLLPWLQVSSLCYTLTHCRLNWNVTTLTTGQFSLLHTHSLQAQLKCYYLDYRSVLFATHSLTAGSTEMLLPWLHVSSLCYTFTRCRLSWNVTTLTAGQFSLLHTHSLPAQLKCYYLDYRSVLFATHSLTAGSTEMLLPWLQVSSLCYTFTRCRLSWNVTTLTTGQFSLLHTHSLQAQLKCYYLDYRSVLFATYSLAAGSAEMLLPWLQVSSLCYTLTHCRLSWNVTTLTTGQFSLLHTHSLQAQLKCYYLNYRSVLFATHSLTAGSTAMLLPWLQVSSLCYTLTHCRLNWNVTTLTTGQFSLLLTHSLQAQLKCYYPDYRSVLSATHSLAAGSAEMLLPWLQVSSLCYTLTHCRLNWNVTTLTTGQFSLLHTHSLQAQLKCYYLDYRSVLFATHSLTAGSTEMLLPWLQVSSLCYTLTHCRLNWNVTTLTTGQFALLHTHLLQAQLKCYYLDYRSVLSATHSLTAGSAEMLLP